MSSQQKASFRTRKSKKAQRSNSKYFYRNALLFLKLITASVVSFFIGFLLCHLFEISNGTYASEHLYEYFTGPFADCTRFSDFLLRILRSALPALLRTLVLLISLTAKTPRRVLFLFCAAVQLSEGFQVSVLSALFKTSPLLNLPFYVLYTYNAVELALSFLFCIYSYRLTLCFFMGFPGKRSAPGTIRRFCSYTARLLFWTLLLSALRVVIFAL